MPNNVNLSFADIIEQKIKEEAAKSFLQKAQELRQKQVEEQWGTPLSPEVEHANRVLGDYAQKFQNQQAILGLIPSIGNRVSFKPQSFAKITPKTPVKTLPENTNFEYLFGVVAPFLKKYRREVIKKAMENNEIYDKTSRIDPDLKEIPGITQKVKEKRAELIDSWNPEIQKLYRMQVESVPDGISKGDRGGVFYSPNFRNFMYKNNYSGTKGSEGGNFEIIKNKKFNNPFIIRRDSYDFIGDSGLNKLLGKNAGQKYIPSDDFNNIAPKWLRKEIQKEIKKDNSITDYDPNFRELILSKLLKRAGYDAALATRPHPDVKYEIDKNKVSGPFSTNMGSNYYYYKPDDQGNYKKLKYKTFTKSEFTNNLLPPEMKSEQIVNFFKNLHSPFSIYSPDVPEYHKKTVYKVPYEISYVDDIIFGKKVDAYLLEDLFNNKSFKVSEQDPFSIKVYKKPLQANQLFELGFDKEKARAAEEAAKSSGVYEDILKEILKQKLLKYKIGTE
jgi:hypothetical protein